MKVLISKATMLALALSWAHSASAAGWLNSYVPSWIAKPVSWVGACVAPYLPASVSDANEIKRSLEKPLSAAQFLLEESQKVRNERIFPKIDEIKKDLGQLDASLSDTQKKHEDFFEQHARALNLLDKNQQELNQALRNTVTQVLALNDQHTDAHKSVVKLKQEFGLQHQDLMAQVHALSSTFDEHSAKTDALVEKSTAAINDFDTQMQSDLISTKKKVDSSTATLDKLIQENAHNDKNIQQLLEKLKEISKTLEEKRQRKQERRQARRERKASQNSSSAMLAHAVKQPKI